MVRLVIWDDMVPIMTSQLCQYMETKMYGKIFFLIETLATYCSLTH